MPRRPHLLPLLPLLILPAIGPRTVTAQQWNDSTAMALVRRAVDRRAGDPARGLRDFQARAHGFVFFLAQLGENQLHEPPHLVKSDQLVLEVYWKAPGASKQRIVGWRDRVDLPTEIEYHRDHLGIVQNGFADRIRLGEGQEVRDVPHPLAPDGRTLYEFALVDSTRIGLPQRTIRVHEVAFRPRARGEPRIVGSLFLDADGGELVRMRFNFTRAAYRDPSLEDITVLLDNGLWEGRYWLPRRQEIEIRRRTTWLELPARGIIRGRWEIDSYAFNVGLADEVFYGAEIVAAPPAERDTFRWERPLDEAIAEASREHAALELEAVRARVRDLVGAHTLSGLAPSRPAVGSLSELVHFNRVEGLAVGAGYVLRPGGGTRFRGWVSYGVSDERLKGRVEIELARSATLLSAWAARVVEDFAGQPVISPLLNSILAQEAGTDHGDYLLREAGGLRLRQALAPGVSVTLGAGVEHTRSAMVQASPARGSFRANPALGAGTFGTGRVRVEAIRGSRAFRRLTSGAVTLDGGAGEDVTFGRLRADLHVARPLGPLTVSLSGWGGAGTADLPAHREFVLGGLGTLPGTPFRGWGGRRAAFGRLEIGVPVPAPAVPLGPFASTGGQAIVAPFIAVGWAHRPSPASPWVETGAARAVVGVAVEWFHRLLRAELGWWPAGGEVGVMVDVRRDLWPVL